MILQEMLNIILIVLTFAITIVIYKWYIQPKMLMNYYERIFKNKGYSVVKFPYKPLSSPFFQERFADQLNHRDPMYHHKRAYSSVQVVISNHLSKPSIVLMNPQMLKQIYSSEKYSIFERQNIIFDVWMSIFGHGLVASQKSEWKNKRKLLSKIFTYDSIIEALPTIISITNKVFDQFQGINVTQKQNNKVKQVKYDVFKMVKKYTSLILLTKFLGTSMLQDNIKVQDLIDSIMNMSYIAKSINFDMLVMIFGMKFVKQGWRKKDKQYMECKQKIKNFLTEAIADIEKQTDDQMSPLKLKGKSQQKCAVRLLLEQKKKDPLYTNLITTGYLIDEIVTFVLAGIDSTSTFLASMMLLIFQKPKVVQKLKNEINLIIKSDCDITVSNFKKLPYTQCVINEISRMISGAVNGFTRKVTEDVHIGGIPIKKNTLIDSSWINFLHNPQIFKDPLEFNPDRWIDNQNIKQHQQLISLIFGEGPRSCIGKSVALVNIKVMIIKFMQRYQNLVELQKDQRAYECVISYGISTTQCLLTKAKQ